MPGKHFKFAISTLSCASSNILLPHQIMLPHYATPATIDRLAAMRHALQHTIPLQDCTASLHVGYMINSLNAAQELQNRDIPISSIDTPDVVSLLAFFIEILKNTFSDMSFRKIKTTLGWQFASVTDNREFIKKVSEGIASLNSTDTIHFIRSSCGSWHKDRVGQTLLDLLSEKSKQFETLALALEIDAKHQTPEEYFEFVYKLQKHNPKIPIYFDLDVGHIAEARKRHRHKSIEKSEIIVEKLLSNKKYSHLIGMLSLNQYDHTQDETHISLLKGSIDYLQIIRMLGQAVRGGQLHFDPAIMAEFSPFAYREMMSLDGIKYFHQLKKAYFASNSSILDVLKPTTTSSSIQS